MKRREFILYGGAAIALPAVAKAQSGKLLTLGFLGTGTPQTQGTWLAALVQRLRELNWIDGHTIAIDVRWAEGRPERYAEITGVSDQRILSTRPDVNGLPLSNFVA